MSYSNVNDFIDRLDIVVEGMEGGLDDWPIASHIWEYRQAISIIKNQQATIEKLTAENQRYEEFVTKAFLAHPNLDVDIEKV